MIFDVGAHGKVFIAQLDFYPSRFTVHAGRKVALHLINTGIANENVQMWERV